MKVYTIIHDNEVAFRFSPASGIVGYRTRISYRTRMVHTVCVYAYGTTIRVWYGYLYHMGIYYIFTVQLYSNTILFDICLRSILSPFNALCSFLPSDVLAQPALIKSVAG